MSDVPGYDLDDAIPIDTMERKKALADPVRSVLVDLVLERAMTVTELAAVVGKSKGTVAHHVDVLCDAGLLRVVRTRKVRAIDERYYGRTARTYLLDTDNVEQLPFHAEAVADWDHVVHGEEDVGGFTLRRARVPAARAHEFWLRLEALTLEFTTLPREGDREYALYVGVFPTTRRLTPAPKRPRARPAAPRSRTTSPKEAGHGSSAN